MDGCSEVGGAAILILVLVGFLIVCGVAVVNWADVQRHHIQAEIAEAEYRAEQARVERAKEETRQEEEETKQQIVQGVTRRMDAVNRLPLVPVLVVLCVLSPCVMYILGILRPQWFTDHLPGWML